ncbi:MAG: hypothetical protein WCF67_16375, partial [Chitinophagaceae bacterium]
HTLATLFPAYHFSSSAKIPFAFDVEDYHPGEKNDVDVVNEKARREYLMKQMLPHAVYVSSASQLISEHTAKLCGLSDDRLLTVANFFESSEFIPPAVIRENKLRLVWFSQNITAFRGLELLFASWPRLQDICTLTLIGLPDPGFVEHTLAQHRDVVIQYPLNQVDLHKLLAGFDIGLALELASTDFNRRLALTNKIIAYAQAGLYVLATDTPSQELFVKENPFVGETVAQDPEHLSESVMKLYDRKNEIRSQKQERYMSARRLSWDVESEKLRKKWLEILR